MQNAAKIMLMMGVSSIKYINKYNVLHHKPQHFRVSKCQALRKSVACRGSRLKSQLQTSVRAD